jgi:hypothetical protein
MKVNSIGPVGSVRAISHHAGLPRDLRVRNFIEFSR